MEVVIDQLGGTSSTVAERLSVSPRTVEAWRSGKAPLNSRAAYHIAAVIKNCAAEIASRLATPPKAGMPWMIKEESVLPSANDIAKLAAEIVERNKVLKAAKDGKYLSYDQLNGWQIA
jgi:DNA-binding transcriptional regulator YdaS (Cro superfamily)